MKFKKSTVFLFASAIVLGTGVFIYEVTIAPQMEEAKSERQKIFDFELDDVKSLTLETPERTLEFDRVESETESAVPQWEMKVLKSSKRLELNDDKFFPANEAYVSFLLSLLINAQSDLQIPLSPEQETEYGLDKPQATIDFTLNNNDRYQLILGGRDFSDNLLYAIASSAAELNAKPTAIFLPTNFENGVNRPLSEWKADFDRTEEETSNPESTPNSTSEETSNDTVKPEVDNSDVSTPEETELEETELEETELEETEAEEIELEETEAEEIELEETEPEETELEETELEETEAEETEAEENELEETEPEETELEETEPEETEPEETEPEEGEEQSNVTTPETEEDTTSSE